MDEISSKIREKLDELLALFNAYFESLLSPIKTEISEKLFKGSLSPPLTLSPSSSPKELDLDKNLEHLTAVTNVGDEIHRDESNGQLELTLGLVPTSENRKQKSWRLEIAIAESRWNKIIAPLLNAPQIERWTKMREGHLRQRLKEFPDLWDRITEEARLVDPKILVEREGFRPFLKFDFLISSPTKLLKFLEGNYRKKGANNVRPGPTEEELRKDYLEELEAARRQQEGLHAEAEGSGGNRGEVAIPERQVVQDRERGDLE